MSEVSFNLKTTIRIITIAIYLIFIFSITYNYAYFWALGLSLSQIPITVGDIVNSAFSWAPTVTILLASGFLGALVGTGGEERKSKKEIIQSSSPSLWKKLQRSLSNLWGWIWQSPLNFLTFMAVIALINFIIVGQELSFDGTAFSIFFFFAILWFWIGNKLSDSPLIRMRKSLLLQLLIIFLPIVIALFLALGYDNAAKQISNLNETRIITLNNDNKFSAKILFNFDKGLLLKDPIKNEMIFLPWAEIRRIDIPYEKKLFYRGFLYKNISSKGVVKSS